MEFDIYPSCRFGFVEFSDVESASKSRDMLQGKEIDGRNISVQFAQERSNTLGSGGRGRGRGGGGFRKYTHLMHHISTRVLGKV